LFYSKNLFKIFSTIDFRTHSKSFEHFALKGWKERERSERKIYEIEEVFELQKANLSSDPENPAFGGFSGFSVPIRGTGRTVSKRGTIPPNWERMASLSLVFFSSSKALLLIQSKSVIAIIFQVILKILCFLL
jgi:hypothetical protein